MNRVEIKSGIYSVGVVDWNVRSFHGYSTNRGVTYNAYLIMDEKITLIDAVKDCFSDELIERISEIIDPSRIDYIVSNHVEMDHSGALPAVMNLAKNATIVTSSPSGLKGLKAHYGDQYHYMPVKAGDTLSLGKRTLQFVGTPMLHWPDNMVTYCPEEKLLFSNDAFGQHYCTSKRFDDEIDLSVAMHEALKYYCNILMPFGVQAKKALSIVRGLELEMIAPSHGIIWRSHIEDILAQYEEFCNGTPTESAVIVYDSMWHSTEKMAFHIAEGFAKKGLTVHYFDLKCAHYSDIVCDILKAKYIAVGSSTLNNQMLPTVASFLCYLKGLTPKNKKAFAFGSYGWSGQSPALINEELKTCGFELVLEPIKQLYVPTAAELNTLEDTVAALD